MKNHGSVFVFFGTAGFSKIWRKTFGYFNLSTCSNQCIFSIRCMLGASKDFFGRLIVRSEPLWFKMVQKVSKESTCIFFNFEAKAIFCWGFCPVIGTEPSWSSMALGLRCYPDAYSQLGESLHEIPTWKPPNDRQPRHQELLQKKQLELPQTGVGFQQRKAAWTVCWNYLRRFLALICFVFILFKYTCLARTCVSSSSSSSSWWNIIIIIIIIMKQHHRHHDLFLQGMAFTICIPCHDPKRRSVRYDMLKATVYRNIRLAYLYGAVCCPAMAGACMDKPHTGK